MSPWNVSSGKDIEHPLAKRAYANLSPLLTNTLSPAAIAADLIRLRATPEPAPGVRISDALSLSDSVLPGSKSEASGPHLCRFQADNFSDAYAVRMLLLFLGLVAQGTFWSSQALEYGGQAFDVASGRVGASGFTSIPAAGAF